MTAGDGAPGRLYVVSTPIGNMGDFTFRAVEVLRSVSAILAEDTRHSRPLLDRYEIHTPLVAYHEHNEARSTPQHIERLRKGEDLALISDAGTPLLSDPGARLVQAACEAGAAVVPVPGASALLAALVASGMDATRFTFFGFLARGGKERREAIEELVRLRHTAVLYEAPGRVGATLNDVAKAGGGARNAAVVRELTKVYEEVRRGTVAALAAYYMETTLRGEIVMVIAGAAREVPDEDVLRTRARTLRSAGMSARDVARALTDELGASRNVAYRIAQNE